MKNCLKCNEPLVEGSKFCNACGAPADMAKTEAELIAEEQAVLNRFSLGLKHERMAWKFASIAWIIFSAFLIAFGLVFGLLAGAAAIAQGGELIALLPLAMMYFFMGLMFLPIAIINLSMKNKLANYREKLFTDCNDGIGHFSVGSIVFCAFFNEVALVFNIVYFIFSKRNAAVIKRIKARQAQLNTQQ